MAHVSCYPKIPPQRMGLLTSSASDRFELALGWFGNFDSYDLAALNLLAHGPPVRSALAVHHDKNGVSGAAQHWLY